MQLTGTRRMLRFRQHPKAGAPLAPTGISNRVTSIDLLRGLVMVIMAIDHVRDYFHADAFLYDPTDLSRTNIPLFFTRFITHFCAPVFMLLSGTSAYLVGMRKGKQALSRFLFTRGLWLILLELTVINFGWFFDPGFNNLGTLVIWALGVSMVLLSALIYLPLPAILGFSLLLIFGHNLLDGIHISGQGVGAITWSLLHEPGMFRFGGVTWFALYPLVPWVGVMALGYCLGSLYQPTYGSAKRKTLLFRFGLLSILAFLLLRYSNWYGEPVPWSHQPSVSYTLLSFLSLSKYPPSLLYLLITLGPALLFLAVTEHSRGFASRALQVIGRVPMFYYLVHIYLIHLAAMLAAALTPGHQWSDMILTTWVVFQPTLKGYGIGLGATYLVWLALVVMLYFPCRWYDRYKRSHQHWWLSYF